jgi:hypothetical protein
MTCPPLFISSNRWPMVVRDVSAGEATGGFKAARCSLSFAANAAQVA